jgi:hypothetical protein
MRKEPSVPSSSAMSAKPISLRETSIALLPPPKRGKRTDCLLVEVRSAQLTVDERKP